MADNARFVIYRDSLGEYRWRFRATNGEIIADSAESYRSRYDCKQGVRLMRGQAPGADEIDVTD